MRILITNDDGIHAPGLAVLENIARVLSDDVIVVAPETDQSGVSHSLSLSQPLRLRSLVPIAVILAAIFFAETVFIIYFVQASPFTPTRNVSDVGLTSSIGGGLFTTYLLPFEITSILLLMAIVGAMTLARRGGLLSSTARVIPGTQQFPLSMVDPTAAPDDLTPVETETTDEAARLLGVEHLRDPSKRD